MISELNKCKRAQNCERLSAQSGYKNRNIFEIDGKLLILQINEKKKNERTNQVNEMQDIFSSLLCIVFCSCCSFFILFFLLCFTSIEFRCLLCCCSFIFLSHSLSHLAQNFIQFICCIFAAAAFASASFNQFSFKHIKWFINFLFHFLFHFLLFFFFRFVFFKGNELKNIDVFFPQLYVY